MRNLDLLVGPFLMLVGCGLLIAGLLYSGHVGAMAERSFTYELQVQCGELCGGGYSLNDGVCLCVGEACEP